MSIIIVMSLLSCIQIGDDTWRRIIFCWKIISKQRLFFRERSEKSFCSERENCLFKYCGILNLHREARKKKWLLTHDFGTDNVCNFSETVVVLFVRFASHAMGHDSRLHRSRLSRLCKLRRGWSHRAGDWSRTANETPPCGDDGQRQAREFREWWSVAPVGAVTDPSSLFDE